MRHDTVNPLAAAEMGRGGGAHRASIAHATAGDAGADGGRQSFTLLGSKDDRSVSAQLCDGYLEGARAARWFAPGDFLRDRVQSRLVLFVGLSSVLLVVALVSLSSVLFRFPSARLRQSTPAATTLHCGFVPFGLDNATLSGISNASTPLETGIDLLGIAGRLLQFATAPTTLEAPHYCESSWLAMAADAQMLFPWAPVLRVVDDLNRGVPNATVWADAEVIARGPLGGPGAWQLLQPPQPLRGSPWHTNTSQGGFATFPDVPISDDLRHGVVLRVTMRSEGLGEEHAGVAMAFRPSPVSNSSALNTLAIAIGAVDGSSTGDTPGEGSAFASETPTVAVTTGQSVRVDAIIRRPDGSRAANTPVVLSAPVLDGTLGPGGASLRGVPALAISDAQGRVNFTVYVDSADTDGVVALQLDGDAAFQLVAGIPLPHYVVLDVSTPVTAVTLSDLPPKVLRVGDTLTPTDVGEGDNSFGLGFVGATATAPPTRACVTPPLPHKLVRLSALPLVGGISLAGADDFKEAAEAGDGDAAAGAGATDDEFVGLEAALSGPTYASPRDLVNGSWPVVAPSPPRMIDGAVWPTQAWTGDDGCAVFDGLYFTEGSTGMYALEFATDGGVAALSTAYMVVNTDMPQYSAMAFLGGGGTFVRVLFWFATPLAIMLCCANRGHTLVGRLVGLVLHSMWLSFVVWQSFEVEGGVFVVGDLLDPATPAIFIGNCCSFAAGSATTNMFSLLLLLAAMFMTAHATLLFLQAALEAAWAMRCSKRRREPFVRAREMLLGWAESEDRRKVAGYYRVVKRLLHAPATRAAQSEAQRRKDVRRSLEAATFYAEAKAGIGVRARALAAWQAGGVFCFSLLRALYALLVLWWYGPAVKGAGVGETCQQVAAMTWAFPVAAAAFIMRLARLVAWVLPSSEDVEDEDDLDAMTPARRAEAKLAFRYPMRLVATAMVALFLTALLAIFIAVTFAWASAFGYEALYTYWGMRDAALPNYFAGLPEPDFGVAIVVWPPSASRYSLFSRLLFGGFGLLLDLLYALLEAETYDMVFRDIVPPAIAGLAFLCWAGMAVAWLFIFRGYRGAVMRARGGQWPFEKREVLITNSTKYLPYQVANAMVGFLGLFFVVFWVVLFIVLAIFIEPLGGAVLGTLGTAFAPPAGVLFQSVVIVGLTVIAREALVRRRDQVVRNYAYFSLFDFWITITHFVVGVLAVLKRLAVLVAGVSAAFWRLDKRWFAKVSTDAGHHAYCAMMMADLLHNNPIVAVFCDVLAHEVNARRALEGHPPVSQEEYMPCPFPCCCCCGCVPTCKRCYDTKRGEGMCSSTEPACLNRRRLRASTRTPEEAETQLPLVARPSSHLTGRARKLTPEAAARQRRQRIINRWWLFLVLERNPAIRRYRRHRSSNPVSALALTTLASKRGRVRQRITALTVRTSTQPRFCMLVDGYVVLYRTSNDLRPVGTVFLADCDDVATTTPAWAATLQLSTPFGGYTLEFDSPEDRNAWRSTVIEAQQEALLRVAQEADGSDGEGDGASGGAAKRGGDGGYAADRAARVRSAGAGGGATTPAGGAHGSPGRRASRDRNRGSFFRASSSHATSSATARGGREETGIRRGGAASAAGRESSARPRRGSDGEAPGALGVAADSALTSSRERGEAERRRVLAKAQGTRRSSGRSSVRSTDGL